MQELELFKTVNRTDRQKVCAKNWLKNKGKGTLVACTGFGKTRVALILIKALLAKHPKTKVLVVVPTETLKNQWISLLDQWGFGLNCDVQIINTVIKNKYYCDLLIIDVKYCRFKIPLTAGISLESI